MQTTMISVIKNFSENPSGRYRKDGPNSGQRFREDFLAPALRSSDNVTVVLDASLGYGSSFLEEAFGGLLRNGFEYGELRRKLDVTANLKVYKDRVWRYIEEEAERRGGK